VKTAEREERPDNVINLMDALRQSLKGKAPAKRSGHASPRASRRRPGSAKKAHRSAARQRKAG
jgi:non-homologous end joining protein Ku